MKKSNNYSTNKNSNKIITRKLISTKDTISKTGKPKTEYTYIYKYTTDQPTTKKDVAYAESLHIPNKINNDSLRIYPSGSRVLATYNDLKGRKIHKYSRKEVYDNVVTKFNRVRNFLKDHERIISRIKKDINPNTDEGQAALILSIIADTGLRVGNSADRKAEQFAYGISTLLNKHVQVLPDRVKLDFIGKKGIRNMATIKDPILVKNIKFLKSKNWSDPIFTVSASQVRDYLRTIDDRFIVKDFRTLKANKIARNLITLRKGPAPTEKIFRKWQLEVADNVAKELGNTRSVALNDYIDPQIWDLWRKKDWGSWLPKKLIVKAE